MDFLGAARWCMPRSWATQPSGHASEVVGCVARHSVALDEFAPVAVSRGDVVKEAGTSSWEGDGAIRLPRPLLPRGLQRIYAASLFAGASVGEAHHIGRLRSGVPPAAGMSATDQRVHGLYGFACRHALWGRLRSREPVRQLQRQLQFRCRCCASRYRVEQQRVGRLVVAVVPRASPGRRSALKNPSPGGAARPCVVKQFQLEQLRTARQQ